MALDDITSPHRGDRRALVGGFMSVCADFAKTHGVDALDRIVTDAVNASARERATIQNIRERGSQAIGDDSGAITLNSVFNGDVDAAAPQLLCAFGSGHLPSGRAETAAWMSQQLGSPSKLS